MKEDENCYLIIWKYQITKQKSLYSYILNNLQISTPTFETIFSKSETLISLNVSISTVDRILSLEIFVSLYYKSISKS